MRFSVKVAEYLSGRNLNMVFSTFILRYVESKFTLLTYLMENNTVITVISYCTKGLNNSKTKQKPIPTIHNMSIKRRKKKAQRSTGTVKSTAPCQRFFSRLRRLWLRLMAEDVSAFGQRRKFPPHARKPLVPRVIPSGSSVFHIV